MADAERVGFSEEEVRGWLTQAGLKPWGCYLCQYILKGTKENSGIVRPLMLSGPSLTVEEQVLHLARCIGGKTLHA